MSITSKFYLGLIILLIGFVEEAKSQQISFGPTQFVPVKKGGEVLLADTNWQAVWIGVLKWDLDSSIVFTIPQEKLFTVWLNLSIELLSARFEGEHSELFSYTTSPQLPATINPGDEFYVELKCDSPELITEPISLFFRMFFTTDDNDTVYFGGYILSVLVGIEEEEINNPKIYYIGNNCYILNEEVENVELFDIIGRRIKIISDEKIIDLNNLSPEVYFLKYKFENKIKIEKIIKH